MNEIEGMNIVYNWGHKQSFSPQSHSWTPNLSTGLYIVPASTPEVGNFDIWWAI